MFSEVDEIKSDLISEWVTDWQCHLLSCPGQLITLLKILIMIQQNPKLWLHKLKELSLLKYHPRFDLNQAEFLPSVRENGETQGCDFTNTCWMFHFYPLALLLLSNVHPSHLETESLLLLRLVVTLADEDANPTLDNHVFVATRWPLYGPLHTLCWSFHLIPTERREVHQCSYLLMHVVPNF